MDLASHDFGYCLVCYQIHIGLPNLWQNFLFNFGLPKLSMTNFGRKPIRPLEFTSWTGGRGPTNGFTARCKGSEGTPECLQLTKLVAGTDIDYPICVGLTTPLV